MSSAVDHDDELTRARLDGDDGSTSLTVALLTPIFVVLMFAAVQAALWGHARTEARVAAKSAAVQVARQGSSADDARATAAANLADAGIDDVEILITPGDGVVVVQVSGNARGILLGTSRRVRVVEAVPVEELTER
ncbi:TadE family protein [Ilumatobacter coccineus]|nr:TadE family protein [Ilumatobacter coccineus]